MNNKKVLGQELFHREKGPLLVLLLDHTGGYPSSSLLKSIFHERASELVKTDSIEQELPKGRFLWLQELTVSLLDCEAVQKIAKLTKQKEDRILLIDVQCDIIPPLILSQLEYLSDHVIAISSPSSEADNEIRLTVTKRLTGGKLLSQVPPHITFNSG